MLVCAYSTPPAWMDIAVVAGRMCGFDIILWKLLLSLLLLNSPLSLLIQSFVLRSKFTFPVIAFAPTTAGPVKCQS